MNELTKRLLQLKAAIENLIGHLGLPQIQQRLMELEDQMQEPDFWKDTETAQAITQTYTRQKKFFELWNNLQKNIAELEIFLKQTRPDDTEGFAVIEEQLQDLETTYKKERIVALLAEKYDDHDCILALHSGAGGADAQDWTEMLMRMYLRFCEHRGFITEILESHKGSEGGMKSALIKIAGPFAFGYLKTEAGVHRLVRQSPFNPAHTRETSFALVEVLPALGEPEHIQLDPKELVIEANTASGHGGQSVNTTYSAIRITHIPTGIKVSIQNERSQSQNKALAMQILQARLQALETERVKKEKKELRGEFKSAEWGNQIRSYVLHPYKLVKDHRTNVETSDPDQVLNGGLENFIEAALEQKTTRVS